MGLKLGVVGEATDMGAKKSRQAMELKRKNDGGDAASVAKG